MENEFFDVDQYALWHLTPGYSKGELIKIRLFSKGVTKGEIQFFPPDNVPQSRIWKPGSQPHEIFELNFPIDRFQEIIETLRYEKPMSIQLNWESKDDIMGIVGAASREPIGEQEGV